MSQEVSESTSRQQKSPNPLKWRLKYGQRPPRKTEEELQKEQDEIEMFLKNKNVTTIPANTSSKKPTADKSDKSLMSKFAAKHLR